MSGPGGGQAGVQVSLGWGSLASSALLQGPMQSVCVLGRHGHRGSLSTLERSEVSPRRQAVEAAAME